MQWSWRFSPTGSASRTSMPSGVSWSSGPIPDSISSWGE